MAYYKSIVAYDGTDFFGFQRQARAPRTVQAELERALHSLGWGEHSLKAAGRTDRGVHARGQVIAYHLDWRSSPDRLTQALNAHLPSDVAVRDTEPAPPGFHPRTSARARRYSYRLLVSPHRDPLTERTAWRVWPAPDVSAMEGAARTIRGRQDFGAFGTSPRPGGHTVRRVSEAAWERREETLTFEIEGDAFLYHMVRRLVSAMVAVGRGRLRLEEFRRLLEQPRKRWQGRPAPARGLTLEAVFYDPESHVQAVEPPGGDRR